jgi:hypothetical protein
LACKNWLDMSEALVNIGTLGFDRFSCDLTTIYPMISYQYDCENPSVPSCPTNIGFDQFSFACLGPETEKTK